MICVVEGGGFRLTGDDSSSSAADEYNTNTVPVALCFNNLGRKTSYLLSLVTRYKLMLRSATCGPY